MFSSDPYISIKHIEYRQNYIKLDLLFNIITYKSQSTAMMNDKCSSGRFNVDKTISIVTREALGTLATPILVAVEIRLKSLITKRV